MNDYVVGMEHIDRYRVVKFGMGSIPETIYTVGWYSADHLTCSCPGGNHPDCKHRKMVRLYVRNRYPIINCFWEGKRGEINGCYSHITPEWKAELEGLTDLGRAVVPRAGPKRISRPKPRR